MTAMPPIDTKGAIRVDAKPSNDMRAAMAALPPHLREDPFRKTKQEQQQELHSMQL